MTINQRAATWHTVADTALGELTLVRDQQGIAGVYFPHHRRRPDAGCLGPFDDRGFDEVKAQLSEYLSGERREFTVALSVTGGDLDRRVWDRVSRIDYGRTAAYGELARGIGGGVTAREVGGIVARNPVCVLVPCHRVLGRGGELTGYAGGLHRKRLLLDLELDHQGPDGHGLFSALAMADAS